MQMRVPVYLLAGGQSRRFGSDKARALLHGQPLLQHMKQCVQPLASQIKVVAREAGAYEDLGFTTLPDALPARGPLGGLYTALLDLKEDESWLLLMPCDLLGVQTTWLTALLTARQEGDHAVAFMGEHWEPLCALYHRSALPQVKKHLDHDLRALWRLLDALHARALPLPDAWDAQVIQANTPAALPW
jgi:molybdopterin-guanine dinucleotide biosynthesis protein A